MLSLNDAVLSGDALSQAIGAFAGLELLTAVLLVWRGSPVATTRLLAIQGIGLGGLVLVLAVNEASGELLAIAVVVLTIKAGLLPRLLAPHRASTAPRPDPTPSLLAVAGLSMLAYLVARPMVALVPGPAGRAVPVGIVLVLAGFLTLVTRRQAHTQLVGFLMVDNGIATVAFLTAGGVPLVVELGVSLDVVLVVLVLQVLSGRMRRALGDGVPDDLRELRD